MAIPAIILAAGASRRLGQPKQMIMYEGETLLERAIRVATEAGASPVFVVLGANVEIICAAKKSNKEILVHNDRWPEGISTSIHAGLREINVCCPTAPGVLLMGCDQPRLTAKHLRELIAAFDGLHKPGIAASSYVGINGVPAIFPNTMFDAFKSLRGDRGARTLIEKESGNVAAVRFEGGEIDIDFPDDLASLD